MTMDRKVRSVLIVGALALAASPLLGQEALERVDLLARAGRADEARAELAAWWDAGRGSASRNELQRGIWLRALLTVDPWEAGLDFQRLVVEFPGGLFSDQALLRMAQAAEAGGDLHGAADHHRVILRDYPGSPLRLQSRAWLAENEALLAQTPRVERPRPTPEDPPTEEAPPAADTLAMEPMEVVGSGTALPPTGDSTDVEIAVQEPAAVDSVLLASAMADSTMADSTMADSTVADSLGVDSTAAAAWEPEVAELPGKHDVTVPEVSPDSTSIAPAPAASPFEPPAVPEPVGDYTVQLGAFSGEAGARLLADRARRAGLEPRIVAVVGSPLFRVRVGQFEDADPATRLYDRVVRLGFEAMVLADASRERLPGGGGVS